MTSQVREGNERDAGVVEEICSFLTSIPPKSFFLFAGAGSGKTRTLVEVLRRLTGVEPHEAGAAFASRLLAHGQSIRVITYTRNAVAVINGRLGENVLARVSTIHTFCWELIQGHDDDIREALIDLNLKALYNLNEEVAKRKNGATPKDSEQRAILEAQNLALASIPRFLYNPDRNTYGEGALQHSQVIAVAEWLMDSRPTLRQTLVDRHPVILIDESQDTMSGILSALMRVNADSALTLGLLGDHRQRIYTDGHSDLPSIIPDNWERPKLEMNHRSQKRVVDLVNMIWEADLVGRTQPKTGIRQYSRTEKNGGSVRIFIGDARLSSDEKVQREALCAESVAQSTGVEAWRDSTRKYQVLALEHRLAARRGGFLRVLDSLTLIDPEAARPQGNGENKGPSAVQELLYAVSSLAACVQGDGSVDEFAAVEVLNSNERLNSLPTDASSQQARLAELDAAITDFAMICIQPGISVRRVLEPLIKYRVFDFDGRLLRAFLDTEPLPPAPARQSDETKEERQRRGWHQLFASPWAEIGRYKTYMAGRSNLATHQVVKGGEFEHVMVVMDDEDAGGNLFSYDKVFGAIDLTKNDQANITMNKETSVDRTLRLLYVTCSRARESLVLMLWSKDPEAAMRNIMSGGWFTPNEISGVPTPGVN